MSSLHAPTLDAARRRLFGLLPATLGADATAMRRPGKAPLEAAPDVANAGTSAVVTPPALVRWLNRASFGATPALLAQVQALAGNDDARWQVWVDQQLDPAAIADPEVDARITPARYPTLFKSLTQLWTDHHGETANYGVRMRPVSERVRQTGARHLQPAPGLRGAGRLLARPLQHLRLALRRRHRVPALGPRHHPRPRAGQLPADAGRGDPRHHDDVLPRPALEPARRAQRELRARSWSSCTPWAR